MWVAREIGWFASFFVFVFDKMDVLKGHAVGSGVSTLVSSMSALLGSDASWFR